MYTYYTYMALLIYTFKTAIQLYYLFIKSLQRPIYFSKSCPININWKLVQGAAAPIRRACPCMSLKKFHTHIHTVMADSPCNILCIAHFGYLIATIQNIKCFLSNLYLL